MVSIDKLSYQNIFQVEVFLWPYTAVLSGNRMSTTAPSVHNCVNMRYDGRWFQYDPLEKREFTTLNGHLGRWVKSSAPALLDTFNPLSPDYTHMRRQNGSHHWFCHLFVAKPLPEQLVCYQFVNVSENRCWQCSCCPIFECRWWTICLMYGGPLSLQWRHNGRDSVSNHQPRDCLLNRLFRRRSKKTSELRVTGLCVRISPGPVNSPHKWPVTRRMFPFDDVIM